MSNWELITEVKDMGGYYIGWGRRHKLIHMPEPMQPMGKASLVQIGGHDSDYEVRGLTYAHSIFRPHDKGLKLFDEIAHCQTLTEAYSKAKDLKKHIARIFDDITKSDNKGNLLLRSS